MKFTVLGSSGFIGGNLVRYLEGKGYQVSTPGRDVQSLSGENLGHVVYAIGMTGNFRAHPDAAIEAHVNVLQKLIKNASFDSWLYLSSTRVYGSGSNTEENASLSVMPSSDTLYDLSKLLGESICFSHNSPRVRIARLSNVYGHGQSEHTFLGSLLMDLKNTGRIVIGESAESSKDYVSIADVVKMIEKIAINGCERLYNIASGHSTKHGEIADTIRALGMCVEFSSGGQKRALPPINIDRVRREFKFEPCAILDDLPDLLKQKQAEMT